MENGKQNSINPFLFTIYPNKCIFGLNDDNKSGVIYSGDQRIIGFGRGHDICIRNNCNLNNDSYCYISSYNISKASMLCGGTNTNKQTFRVIEFEVFSIS